MTLKILINRTRIKARLEEGAGGGLEGAIERAMTSALGQDEAVPGAEKPPATKQIPGLEEKVAPETAQALGAALDGLSPQKQRQASAVLRALASGKITKEQAADRLEKIEK